MPDLTKNELNTLVIAAFRGTFGYHTPVCALVSKIIFRYRKSIRRDILLMIMDEIDEAKGNAWEGFEKADKVCWAYLLKDIKEQK